MDGWEDSSSSSSSSSRWKDSKGASALRSAGSSLSDSGRSEMASAASERITPVQYKRGGKVRKTGPAIVHRGERVIPRSKVKKVDRMMKRKGMRKTNRGRR